MLSYSSVGTVHKYILCDNFDELKFDENSVLNVYCSCSDLVQDTPNSVYYHHVSGHVPYFLLVLTVHYYI